MGENRLEYRLYGFVMYNLSEIQKGIQFGHAVVEYGIKFCNKVAYNNWAVHDKTFVILNGGTSNDGTVGLYGHLPEKGTMQELVEKLVEISHLSNVSKTWFDFATFREPDANNALTAVCFLVDERVYDYEKYPDFYDYMKNLGATSGELEKVRQGEVPTALELKWKREVMGGEVNYQLRELLKGKKLA